MNQKTSWFKLCHTLNHPELPVTVSSKVSTGGCPHQDLQQDGEHSIEEGKRILKQTQELTEGALHQGGAQSTAPGSASGSRGSSKPTAAEALSCHAQGASIPPLKIQQN